MLNYLGKPRDVMTLAHELGHGVHQLLASKQGEMLSSTPLTLAETASVFGEMLTFRKMLDAAPDLQSRQILMANKVEDMINTVVRQIAFYDFECKLHDARKSGELTPEDINALGCPYRLKASGQLLNLWQVMKHFGHIFHISFILHFTFMPMLSVTAWLMLYMQNMRRTLLDFHQSILRCSRQVVQNITLSY